MNKLFPIVLALLLNNLYSNKTTFNDLIGISYAKISDSEIFSLGFQNRLQNENIFGLGFIHYTTYGRIYDNETKIWLPHFGYDINLLKSKTITSSISIGASILNKDFIFINGRKTSIIHNSLFSSINFNFKFKNDFGFGIQLGLYEGCKYTTCLSCLEIEKSNCKYILMPGFSINLYDFITKIYKEN
ncbi:MAG: hypothetical protein CMG00_01245 [Candidatus Marinimicrobia bacterium]|nr:hypothetical protein [Candidatus Neomarinimicrobiota bacterium]|tara:strand:- start:774 stop:1334 length:561 start_codon:yes stop_codon:yes gene_type:complete